MEHHASALRLICLTIIFSTVGLAFGMIVGVRLGMNAIQNDLSGLKQDIKDLNNTSQQQCIPPIPFNFDPDLEPELKYKTEKLPPITL